MREHESDPQVHLSLSVPRTSLWAALSASSCPFSCSSSSCVSHAVSSIDLLSTVPQCSHTLYTPGPPPPAMPYRPVIAGASTCLHSGFSHTIASSYSGTSLCVDDILSFSINHANMSALSSLQALGSSSAADSHAPIFTSRGVGVILSSVVF